MRRHSTRRRPDEARSKAGKARSNDSFPKDDIEERSSTRSGGEDEANYVCSRVIDTEKRGRSAD